MYVRNDEHVNFYIKHIVEAKVWTKKHVKHTEAQIWIVMENVYKVTGN